MAIYALQRLLYVVGIAAVISILVFLVGHALPENTAQVMLGQYATPDVQFALEEKLGLHRPLIVQYAEWAGNILHGNLGQSLVLEQPIAPVLFGALANSAIVAGAVMLIMPFVGVGLGIVGAVRAGRPADYISSILAYVGVSIPEFLWGLLLMLVLSSYLRLLPTSGFGTPEGGFWSYAQHIVLPVLTLTIALHAHISRLTRASLLEALDSNYVKVARTRGLPEHVVVLRHALRNAMLPTITVLAQDFGYLIGGVVAVETIFAYPGVGRLLLFALERQDIPLMQATVLVLTLVHCLANLGADLLYGLFNPRIRYGRAVD